MVDAYDPAMRAALHSAASRSGVPLHDGVLLATLGPMFETPAEINAYRMLGADVVGMSTVVEVVCARHADLRVAAMSVVVNLAAGMTGDPLTHDETLHFSAQASGNLIKLVKDFVAHSDEWEAK